ncbi:MAG TPA: MarR family transcriptional regulator [Ilumatobacteraceae bacterium]|nr:MarR family transcriptional regulator [Ilumatobacteraceae bacterium]
MTQSRENIGRKLALTARTVRAYGDQQMADAGSSMTVAIIAKILAAEPGLSQRELADRMGVEGPTMVRHLDRLEADDIVVRTRDTQDRRVVRITLTDTGHRLHRRLQKVSVRSQQQLTTIFTPDELDRFEQYLDRIKAHATDLVNTGEKAVAS